MVTERGVVIRDGREVACDCFCHEEPALHFMACCGEPTTDEGRMSLNACAILEGILATHGGWSAELATFRRENPDLRTIIEAAARRWDRGRL